ncbi:MAG TPA: thiamine phosphate synthase [Xanthobacteraceae bacterium]|nr:thiamine phosphate synthase [Xanthobacteraceae bacterium]
MDGGGRLDQPLKRSRQSAARQVGAPHDEPARARAPADQLSRSEDRFAIIFRYRRLTARWAARAAQLPRGTGIAGSVLLIAGALAYGAVAGEHVPAVMDWVKNARDVAASAVGFRIAAISLSGEKEVSREEILTTAGVTGRASLLFLDAAAARARLGTQRLIGVSIHTVTEAEAIDPRVIDYALAGPAFETPSKPGYGPEIGRKGLAAIARSARVPLLAIGGINTARVGEVIAAGCAGVAVMGGVMRAADPGQEVNALLATLQGYPRAL